MVYGQYGTYRVEGARQLRRTLREAGDDMADLKRAHGDASNVAAQAGAARAPRRSGALAADVRSSGTKTAGIIRAGRARIPYANPIHWGWFQRGIKPQPFLSRGAQASESVWLAIFEQHRDEILSRVRGI